MTVPYLIRQQLRQYGMTRLHIAITMPCHKMRRHSLVTSPVTSPVTKLGHRRLTLRHIVAPPSQVESHSLVTQLNHQSYHIVRSMSHLDTQMPNGLDVRRLGRGAVCGAYNVSFRDASW